MIVRVTSKTENSCELGGGLDSTSFASTSFPVINVLTNMGIFEK